MTTYPMMRHVVFSLLLLLHVPALVSAHESRTWTDKSGKFKVEARLHRIGDDRITLLKSDGKYLAIDLAKLCDEDQKYVAAAKEEEENPFAGGTDVEENPFAGGVDPEDVEPKKTPRTSRKASPPPNSIGDGVFDMKAEPLDMESAPDAGGTAEFRWTCEPDAAGTEKFEGRIRSVSFKVGELPFGVWAKEAGFCVFHRDGKPMVLAAMTIDMDRKSEGDSKTRVFLGDMAAGKCTNLDFPEKIRPLGVSPDGTKAVFGSNKWGFGSDWGKRKYLYIVGIGDAEFEPLAAWEPFAQDSKGKSGSDLEGDVENACWIDNEHILAWSARKRLILFEADTGEVVWSMSADWTPKISLSPGNRYCIVGGSSGAVMLETLTGEPVGNLEIASSRSAATMAFGFSPDGRKIAARGADGVLLWDATTGEPQEPFYVGDVTASNVFWTDNRFVLVGNRLVDTETKSLLWSYRLPTSITQAGGHFWYMHGHGKDDRRLLGVVLPHPKALQAAEAPEEERFCVRPGMEVAVEADTSIGEGRTEIVKDMEAKLEANGLVVKPTAPIKVLLKVTKEKEDSVRYSVGSRFAPPMPMFGRDDGGTEIKFTPHKFSIEFMKDDKVLWSVTKTTGPPNHISLDEVQKTSLQKVVDKAMAEVKYKEWFLGTKIPAKIPNFDSAGSSQLGENGIRDQ